MSRFYRGCRYIIVKPQSLLMFDANCCQAWILVSCVLWGRAFVALHSLPGYAGNLGKTLHTFDWLLDECVSLAIFWCIWALVAVFDLTWIFAANFGAIFQAPLCSTTSGLAHHKILWRLEDGAKLRTSLGCLKRGKRMVEQLARMDFFSWNLSIHVTPGLERWQRVDRD